MNKENKKRIVWLSQRVVYNKIGRVAIDVPDDVKTEDVGDWLMNNENDWYDDVAESVYECSLGLGNGMGDGNWTDDNEDVETRYDVEVDKKYIYGGHV